MPKKIAAIHFGAGNIGRGLICPLYDLNGITTIFIDNNIELIQELNSQKKYSIFYDDNSSEKISNFLSYDKLDDENLKYIFDKYDVQIISTSIGINNFDYILEKINRILKIQSKSLNFICFENHYRASTLLKSKLNKTSKSSFIDVLVDRIVPQAKVKGLNIKTERYYEIIVDNSQIKNNELDFIKKGLIFVDNFNAFMFRKFWIINSTHLLLGYMFDDKKFVYQLNQRNYKRYHELQEILYIWFKNINFILVNEFNFKSWEIDEYISVNINRIFNKKVKDELIRLKREPIKKLQKEERVYSLYLMYKKYKLDPSLIYKLVLSMFKNLNLNDKEGLKIFNEIEKNGLEKTIKNTTSFNEKEIKEIISKD